MNTLLANGEVPGLFEGNGILGGFMCSAIKGSLFFFNFVVDFHIFTR